jgi:ubiquinone biosynthesis protein
MPSFLTPAGAMGRIGRFRHVVNALIKHGFGEALSRVRVWEACNIEQRLLRRACEIPELNTAQRLRLALEELGPTFVKLGQILSTRPDIVPPDIIGELKKLQSSVAFVPVATVKAIIEEELGRPIEQVFESFDEQPVAAASLAQVHRAVLQGKPVALKIQRPGIVEMTSLDLDIMRSLASLAERYMPSVYLINPAGLVEEFARQLKKELDFRTEANNMRRFGQNFAGDDTIRIPKPYMDFCTRRLVTMEFLDGISISDTKRLETDGYDLGVLARRGAVSGFKATFQYGFFHADPHPGNILVLPGNVIGLVDYGMMATLSLRDRERLARLVYFITMRDERRVARALNELMEAEDVVPAESLEPSMASIIQEYGDAALREINLAAMLFAMMRAVMTHGGKLRAELLWVTKSIATQEEIARQLGADFNVVNLAGPYAQRVMTQRFNPVRQPRELLNWLIDALDTARDLPYDVGIVLREIRKGRLKIEFEHLGLEPLRRTIDGLSKRLSLTMLTSALLMSSSIMVLAKVPPFVGGIPLLGFLGFLLAMILGVILTVSMLRR